MDPDTTPAAARPDTEPPRRGDDDARLAAFFGPRAGYYLRQAYGRGRRVNFAAFFFGFIWMLYRRMYLVAAAAVLLIAAETVVSELVAQRLGLTTTPQAYDRVMMLFYGLLAGALGNPLYLRHARRKLATLPANADAATIARRGGVSWLAPILALVAFVALVAILVMSDSGPA